MSFEDQLRSGRIVDEEVMKELSYFAFAAVSDFKRGCTEAAKKGKTSFVRNAGDVENTFHAYPSDMNLGQPLRFYFDAAYTQPCNTIGRYGSFKNVYEETFVGLLKEELKKAGFQNATVKKRCAYAAKELKEKALIKSFFKSKNVYNRRMVAVGNITLFEIATAWNAD